MTKHRCHSHYETLRVDRRASPERVRMAYRRLAQKFHPDKHAGKSAAATVMAAINQAYEVLSDPAQRAGYDEWLAAQESGALAATSVAAVFIPDRFGWAVWLLWIIVSIAVLTVGFVWIRTTMPSHQLAARPAVAAQPVREMAAEPPVPTHPVQPWTEPALTTAPHNPETDPAARRVREGTLDHPPRRPTGAP